MKILVIHNFHRKGSASGDDLVFRQEAALLEGHGHEVVPYAVSNDRFDRAGPAGKLLLALGMLWSWEHYRAVRRLIREERPDIVHVHTFFPLLSPSILYAARRGGLKVVATLHDTRLICPCATSLRGGELCNACGDGRYFRMFRHGCFKGSKLQSLLVSGIFRFHRLLGTFYRQIDRYICLNDIQMALLRGAGFDSGKMVKKYNFISDPSDIGTPGQVLPLPERYAVFYGRLGEEKGVRVLMEIWDQLEDIPLAVMGGGPLEDVLKAWAAAKDNVRFLGYMEHEACMPIVKDAEFVVFPSIFYEGCAMVVIEAESLGTALIASDIGFMAEAIEDGVNGYKFTPGDAAGAAKRVRQLWADPDGCRRLGEGARRDYEAKYLPEHSYAQLMDIYRDTAGGAGAFSCGRAACGAQAATSPAASGKTPAK